MLYDVLPQGASELTKVKLKLVKLEINSLKGMAKGSVSDNVYTYLPRVAKTKVDKTVKRRKCFIMYPVRQKEICCKSQDMSKQK